MFTFSYRQYTRKPRVSHLLIALVVAAGGLPAHSATAPTQAALTTDIDPYPELSWLEDVEFYLDILWQLLIRSPPPTMPEDLGERLSAFVADYKAEGIHQVLTLEEREYYTTVVLDFIEHLEMYPDYFDQDLYDKTMQALADILEDLNVIGGVD